MRWLYPRALVLVTGLGLAAAGCGKYSIGNLRATQALQTGNMNYQKGDWPAAIQQYTRAVNFNPDLGFAYFFLGNSYDNLYKPTKRGEPDNDANLDKAVQNYRLAIDKLKGSTESQAPKYLKLSYQYLIAAYGTDKLNDIEKAVPVAQELIASEPNDPTNYQALGRLYEENGYYDEAEANFKKAIEIKPNDPLGWELLAGYYDRQGQPDKTMEALEKRASMEPNNPEAWHSLGAKYSETALKNSQLTKAQAQEYVMHGLEAEDKALAINPDYLEALAYKQILLRQAATYEKDPAKQKQFLNDASTYQTRANEARKKQGAGASPNAKKD